METLYDRDAELQRLDTCWQKATQGQPQLAVIWGRRRVGKTFLLSHFVAGKRSVFFGATQQAEGIELARLAEAASRDLGSAVMDLAGGRFASWEAALRFFVALAADQPLVVVLDEVPYLARSTRGFASIVQAVWDHLPRPNKLLLVLTGSAFGAIATMMGAGGPLRGRPTLSLRLDPLSLRTARSFLPKLKAEDFVRAYAACGGYPLHLQDWDQTASVDTNLMRLAMSAGGILLEDASGILREELPETGGYSRILAAIGCGRSRYSEIAGAAEQRVEQPLDVLVHASFVRRSLPLAAPKAAKPAYEIADVYLAFWFGVLYSEIPQIEAGQGRQVLKRVRPRLETHLGKVFEDAAREHAQRLVEAGELPADLLIGRWWAATGQPCEVDVLGLQGSRSCLLGEAKWQAQPVGRRELDGLRLKTVRVPDPVEEPVYALWGRNGVDPQVRQAGGLGFSLEDILR
ncbi:MAG TPA: ATP-binding protein [Chloroflexota bacterium]|nr:ATP-binding protein [Chloroflexota bacterium]